MAPPVKVEFISKTEFPPYALTCVGDRYVIVGGGGGSAKTGIKNKFDVYQLHHNGQQTTAHCVLSYDVGSDCISNMAAWTEEASSPAGDAHLTGTANKQQINSTTPCPIINLAVGKEESCMILKLTPKLITDQSDADRIPHYLRDDPVNGAVRRRDNTQTQHQNKNGFKPNHISGATLNKRLLPQNAYYSFTVAHICTFVTVFKRPAAQPSPPPLSLHHLADDDVYQKVCRISRDRQHLVTAGTDGSVRVWLLRPPPQPPLLQHTIAAHDKDVDQIDLSPDGRQVVSICKVTRECCVWECKTSKKVMHLALDTPGLKYKFAWARYGTVDGDVKQARLFTACNPVVGSRNPGIVAKWCGRGYTLQKRQDLAGVLSNLAVTEDGRYLATGTMDGDVIILVAFSLQVLQRLPSTHSTFVTGVEWLSSSSRSSRIVRGYSDASLLSVSCDNTVRVTHLPAVVTVPVWLVAVMAAAVLTLTFLLASYLGL